MGIKVSHPKFEALTESWRLAAHIHILKRLGWPIQTEQIGWARELHDERKRSMAIYYLPEDLIAMVYNR
jgi:hypothetical protein